MNIMIVGGGLLGRKTAETLDELGHDVVLIDSSTENLAQLSPDFSGVTSVGFPMDIKSLRSAGIEGCDALDNDHTMIMGCVMLYAVFILLFNLLSDIALAAVNPRIAGEMKK